MEITTLPNDRLKRIWTKIRPTKVVERAPANDVNGCRSRHKLTERRRYDVVLSSAFGACMQGGVLHGESERASVRCWRYARISQYDVENVNTLCESIENNKPTPGQHLLHLDTV